MQNRNFNVIICNEKFYALTVFLTALLIYSGIIFSRYMRGNNLKKYTVYILPMPVLRKFPNFSGNGNSPIPAFFNQEDNIMQHNKGQNLIICIDASISMNSGFGRTTRIQAVNDGVEMMLPQLSKQQGTMIGLVGYNEKPFVVRPLTFPNNRTLVGKVRGIRVGGCTNLLGGIDQSINLLIKRPRCFSRRVIVLTDGYHNSGFLTKDKLVSKAQSNQVVIDTIGIGEEGAYNRNLLIELAQQTGGEFIPVKSLPKLLLSFKRLSAPKHYKSFKPSGSGNKGGKGKIIPFSLFRRC